MFTKNVDRVKDNYLKAHGCRPPLCKDAAWKAITFQKLGHEKAKFLPDLSKAHKMWTWKQANCVRFDRPWNLTPDLTLR